MLALFPLPLAPINNISADWRERSRGSNGSEFYGGRVVLANIVVLGTSYWGHIIGLVNG